jgi:CAAX prenyl protease-like protein
MGAGERAAFNPLAHWPDEPMKAYGFLLVRFVGLAAIVPVIEEFFLRGWLMRFVTSPDWWTLRVGQFDLRGAAAATIVPMLMHPNEAIAAWVWFSLVTWLLLRTRNIWDCVVAHGVTNLLLGLYVVMTGSWWLW